MDLSRIKIRDIIELDPNAPPIVINLEDKETDIVGDATIKRYIRNYILTARLEECFCKIYGKILRKNGDTKAFLVRGSIGTGKSYFLLMNYYIARSTISDEKTLFNEIIRRINDFNPNSRLLELLSSLEKEGIRILPVKVSLKSMVRRDIIWFLTNAINKAATELLGKNLLKYELDVKRIEKIIIKWEQMATKNELMEELLKAFKDFLKKEGYDLAFFKEFLVKRGDEKALDIFNRFLSQTVLGTDLSQEIIGIRPSTLDDMLRSIVEGLEKNNIDFLMLLLDEGDIALDSNDLRPIIENIAEKTRTLPIILLITRLKVEESVEGEKALARFEILDVMIPEITQIVAHWRKIRAPNLWEKVLEGLRTEIEKRIGDISFFKEITRTFPLHPFTANFMKKMDRFSTESRHVFRFFKEKLNKIWEEPLMKEGELTLIYPDELFDYFFEEIQKMHEDLVKIANRLQAALKSGCVGRITKYLILHTILQTGDVPLKEIASLLLMKEKEAKEIMDELVEKSDGLLQERNGIYSILREVFSNSCCRSKGRSKTSCSRNSTGKKICRNA